MTDAENECFGTELSHQEGPYASIIRAMQPGLLITVNNSGGAIGPGSGELRVIRQTDEGEVLLQAAHDRKMLLRPETDRGPVVEKLSDDIGSNTRFVETIEVIGIDG